MLYNTKKRNLDKIKCNIGYTHYNVVLRITVFVALFLIFKVYIPIEATHKT